MMSSLPLTDNLHAPLIETERLILRSHQLSDFDDCVAMWADPEIARFTIGEPSLPTRTWVRLLSYRGHWSMLGFGYWAVEEKASGRFVGEFGFANFKRDQHPELENMPELGWVLASHAQGRGYATEGLLALTRWADTHFNSLDTACIIQSENHRSFRVAEKIGYRAISPTGMSTGKSVLLVRSARAGAVAGLRDGNTAGEPA